MSLLLKAAIEAKVDSPEQARALLDAHLDPALNSIGSASTVESVRNELSILVSVLTKPLDVKNEENTNEDEVAKLGDKKKQLSKALLQPEMLRKVQDYILLSDFGSTWLPLLSSLEREALVEPLFLQTPPLVALLALAQNLDPSRMTNAKTSSLSSSNTESYSSSSSASSRMLAEQEINRIASEQHLRFCIDLLTKFLSLAEPNAPNSPFISCFAAAADLPAIQRTRTWNEIVIITGSLPDRVANLMRRETPAHLAPNRFFDSIVSAALLVLDKCTDTESIEPLSQIDLLAQLLSKICATGRAAQVANAMVAKLLARWDRDSVEPQYSIWFSVLTNVILLMPVTVYEALFECLLQRLADVQYSDNMIVALLLPVIKKQNAIALFLLTSKFITNKLFSYNVVRAFVRLLSTGLTLDKYLDCLASVAQVWGSPTYTKQTTIDIQKRVTAFLLAAIKNLSKDQLERPNLLTNLMGGIHNRMDSALPPVRKLGMMLAEEFSKILQPESALNFEYDLDPIEDPQILGTGGATPTEPQRSGRAENLPKSTTDKSISTKSRITPTPKPKQIDPDALYIPHDDDLDDDTALPNSATEASGHVAAENDEVDDFYAGIPRGKALDDDVSDLKKAKNPVYLRESLVQLRADDPEQIEAALTSLDGLIRSRPDDLTEVCIPLSKAILHLGNEYEIPGFYRLRRGILTALVATCQRPVIDWLVSQLVADNWSMQHRSDILDTLVDAANELSDNIKTRQNEQVQVAPKPLIQDTSEIITESKSRRWGSQKSRGPTAVNRFAALAPSVVLPILSGLQNIKKSRAETSAKLLFTEPVLLSKVVWSLGYMLEVVGAACPDIRLLAKSLAQFLWALRYVDSPLVRRSVLIALRCLVASVPEALFQSDANLVDDLNELFSWCRDAATNDEDEECRKLATICMMSFAKKLK